MWLSTKSPILHSFGKCAPCSLRATLAQQTIGSLQVCPCVCDEGDNPLWMQMCQEKPDMRDACDSPCHLRERERVCLTNKCQGSTAHTNKECTYPSVPLCGTKMKLVCADSGHCSLLRLCPAAPIGRDETSPSQSHRDIWVRTLLVMVMLSLPAHQRSFFLSRLARLSGGHLAVAPSARTLETQTCWTLETQTCWTLRLQVFLSPHQRIADLGLFCSGQLGG